jgi:Uma2 family endonuclease
MESIVMARAVLGYEDYAALPDDGRRYEILDGELSVTPAPGSAHQIILARLFRVIDSYVEARGLGLSLFAPLDVILADSSIVQPDLVYLANDRMDRVRPRGIEGAPTLLVEVLSPGTSAVDRVRKYELYARYGVLFYWLVDPHVRVVEAYRLGGTAYVLALRGEGGAACGPPPPDLDLVVARLWP